MNGLLLGREDWDKFQKTGAGYLGLDTLEIGLWDQIRFPWKENGAARRAAIRSWLRLYGRLTGAVAVKRHKIHERSEVRKGLLCSVTCQETKEDDSVGKLWSSADEVHYFLTQPSQALHMKDLPMRQWCFPQNCERDIESAR